MKLNTFCTLDVACCGRATTALAAARLMRERHVGDVVVVDDLEQGRVPCGVITDRDIVVEALGNNGDPAKITVGSMMRTPVVVVQDTDDITIALGQMSAHGVRRLPVVDHSGALVGLISLDDLLKVWAADAASFVDVIVKQQRREYRTRR